MGELSFRPRVGFHDHRCCNPRVQGHWPVIRELLGMRSATGGTLRMTARRVVSDLQAGKDGEVDSGHRVGFGTRGGSEKGEKAAGSGPVAGLLGYHTAGPGGRSRGSGAASLGLSEAVAAGQLESVLMGRHAQSGEVLVPASGSSGRADGVGLRRSRGGSQGGPRRDVGHPRGGVSDRRDTPISPPPRRQAAPNGVAGTEIWAPD